MSSLVEREFPKGASEGRSVQRALRSAQVATAFLTLMLWAMPPAYCVYLMLLLDVARPGGSAETILGLVGMASLLVALHAMLLHKREQVFAAFAAVCDASGARLHEVRQDRLRALAVRGGGAALIDSASIPVLVGLLAFVAGWLAMIPLVGSVAAIMVLIAGARANKRKKAPDTVRQDRDVAAATLVVQREHLALLGLAERAAAVVTAHRNAAARSDAAASRDHAQVQMMIFVIAALCMAGVAGAATWMVARDAASIGALAATLLLTLFVFHPLFRLAPEITTLPRAKGEWHALREALDAAAPSAPVVALPPPARELEVDSLAVAVPGTRRLTLHEVTFRAEAGDLVAVIGPADFGKSTLLKVMAGYVSPSAGTVRLDGAALNQWGRSLNRHMGYLPQIPGLMPGSVAQNISGFLSSSDPTVITRAAMAAGAHDAIVRLPAGYDTVIGDPAQPALALSVQQRIAWARALYGDPFLVLLDSPGTFQDNDGHLALRRCLAGLRSRGAVAVVVGDSASIIESANLVLVMRKGGMLDFGPKEDVRARLAERQRRDAERLAEVSVCAEPRDVPVDTPRME